MRRGPSTIALILLLSLGAAGALNSPAQAAPSNDLLTAILDGDHNRLERLLRSRANPNERLPDGSLPLAWAVERQDLRAVELLLKHRAWAQDPDPAGNEFRPLVVACLHPSEPVLNALLDAGADVNTRGPEGIPALSLCAARAPSPVVGRLIRAGATVTAADDNGQTALMWAAAHARHDSFKLLLDQGADINRLSKGGFSALMFAAKSGNADIARLALASGADSGQTTADGTTLLQLSIYQGNFQFAEHLVNRQTEVHRYDRNGRQPLHAAVLANEPALVRRLLDAGAPINAVTTRSEVHWRYESNFRAGDYEFPILSPLLLAAREGHAELLGLLAARGADIAHRDAEGNNLVLAAAASNSPDALRVALQLSADANVRNERGDTPLHRALASGTDDELYAMLEILADYGARTDIKNRQGKTAIDIARKLHKVVRTSFATLFDLSPISPS